MTHALIHLVQEDTYPRVNLWECEAGHRLDLMRWLIIIALFIIHVKQSDNITRTFFVSCSGTTVLVCGSDPGNSSEDGVTGPFEGCDERSGLC
jgi:hypothetical protein